MRVVVTGGTGKGGAWVIRELREHGHDVLNVDTRHDESASGLSLVADLTDLGQTQEALAGTDAVVHFAAIPAPGLRPDGETFRNNALSTYNVFAAAVAHNLRRVVWASQRDRPRAPVRHPARISRRSTRPSSRARSRPIRSRSWSARRWPRSSRDGVASASSGSASRTSWNPTTTRCSRRGWDDPRLRRWNLWGYVDARDVAMRRASPRRPRSRAQRSRSSRPPTPS